MTLLADFHSRYNIWALADLDCKLGQKDAGEGVHRRLSTQICMILEQGGLEFPVHLCAGRSGCG